MGIFYEETLNNVKANDSITLAEMRELIKERDELLSELLENTLLQINESMMFTESAWDDLKVKKEDLMDPNKVKALINKIERERIGMDAKAQMLNVLYIFLLALVGVIPGTVIYTIGLAMESVLFAALGYIIMYAGSFAAAYSGADRLETLKNKTKRAIKKVDKALLKEVDPKNRKVLQDQKKALQKTYETFDKESYKVKKDIESRTTYGYNVNYNIN